MQVLTVIAALVCLQSASAGVIVVPTTTEQSQQTPQPSNETVPKPQMYFFNVESDIKYRYARTLINTRIANTANVAQQVTFSAVLPETAFISGFLMEVDGEVYKAYVKEKEEAKREYDHAVQHGQTAAHVALTARDSNRFTVSVNVEPQKKVTFNLTYEELLTRKLGSYKHAINLDPGQIVQDFKVVVKIQESSKITAVKVPALKVSNEIKDDSENDINPLATIEHPTEQSAVATFAPTSDQQKELATDGIKGQLIVEYDVDRTSNPGEVLVNDGYFVHFFAPADLPPLRKQVTFVLDVSGSMSGRKMEQLRQAMTTILGDLNKDDLFSIVLFSQTAQVWDPTLNETEMDARLRRVGDFYALEGEHAPTQPDPSVIVEATPENIAQAKNFVGKLDALASTNIYDGLMLALEISKLGSDQIQNGVERPSCIDCTVEKPEPIILFLTDGQPNVRVYNGDTIETDVTKANTKNSSIFSLALGDDADFSFLKKLSLRNTGFARKIYEASDTALQLRDFYREVASPLLSNVTFEYEPDQVDQESVTKHEFRRLFFGSELVVAGRLREDNFTGEIQGKSSKGKSKYNFVPLILPHPEIPFPPVHNATNHTPSSMERMWAYLTIQQLIEKDEASDYDRSDKNHTSPEKQRALELALQYSFVTPLTSLVVVKPNETKSVDTKDASRPDSAYPMGGYPLSLGGFAGVPAPLGPGPFPQRAPIPGSSHAGAGFSGSGFPARPAVPVALDMAEYEEVDEGMIANTESAFSTTPFIPTTTYLSTTPQARATLGSLNDVTWLQSVSNNSTITLPTGLNGTDEVLLMAPANETNVPYSQCTTPVGEDGHCRHLKFCVLDTFTARKEDFLPYLCHIESYVGVCCPDYI